MLSFLQVKGGVAEADGRLQQGDQILTVNGEDMKQATQEQAAAMLKVGRTKRRQSGSWIGQYIPINMRMIYILLYLVISQKKPMKRTIWVSSCQTTTGHRSLAPVQHYQKIITISFRVNSLALPWINRSYEYW